MLSVPAGRFAWQIWHFQDLYRCPRNLGNELGRIDAIAFYGVRVTLSEPQGRFMSQWWHFHDLNRYPR